VEYLCFIGEVELTKNEFEIVRLNNILIKEKANEMLNEKFETKYYPPFKKHENNIYNELICILLYNSIFYITRFYNSA
jgi:hypothetical protein